MNPTNKTSTYASVITSKSQLVTKIVLKPIQHIHGELAMQFTFKELEEYTIEEGLHQAVVMKLSYGSPDVQELRNMIPTQLGIKGRCLIDVLTFRQLLVRCDAHEDFVTVLSKQVGYLQYKGQQHQYRTFPWTQDYNPKVETSKTVAWVSLPDLPTNLFAKKPLLSIASAVGKPIAIDKATQARTRPSTARVKVILDLLDKQPNNLKLQFIDEQSGKVIEHVQEFVFDNLPLYCKICKRQGHADDECRSLIKRIRGNGNMQQEEELDDGQNIEKYQGDLRKLLDEKKKAVNVSSSPNGGDAVTEQQGAGGMGLDLAENNGGKSHVECPRSVAANAQTTTGVTGVGDVPVATTLARVSHDLKAAKDPMSDRVSTEVTEGLCAMQKSKEAGNQTINGQGQINVHIVADENDKGAGQLIDRGLAGASKGSDIEHRHLQQIMDDSALAGAVRAIIANSNVAVAGVQFDTPGNVGSVVQTARLDAAIVVGSGVEGIGQTSNDQGKAKDQQVTQVASKPTAANKVGQELSKRDVATKIIGEGDASAIGGTYAKKKVSDTIETGSQDGQQSHAKGWSVVHRSPSKKVSSGHDNLESTAETFRFSNSFDALVCAHEHGKKDSMKNVELMDGKAGTKCGKNNTPGSVKQQRKKKSASARSVASRDIVPVDDFNNVQVFNEAPTLKLSSPELAKMIKESQAAMIMHTTPKSNMPLVTLNTSVQEIPSRSCGERDGDYGQQLLSTGNDQHVEKVMASISLSNSTSEQPTPKGREEVTGAILFNRKLWADQEEDDDYDDSLKDDSKDEAGQDSYTSNDEAIKGHDEQVPNSSSTLASKRGLSPNAPVFIPTGQQQSSAIMLKDLPNTKGSNKALTPGMSTNTSAHFAKYNLTPTNIIQALVSHDMEPLKMLGNSSKAAAITPGGNTILGDQQAIQPMQERVIGEQQIGYSTPAISAEDRRLLDSLVSTKPSLNSTQTMSTGHMVKNRDNIQNVEQHQGRAVMEKTQNVNALMTQGFAQDMPNLVIMGRDTYEEGEEDDILNQCRAEAARKGDLSPMYSGKKKKTHTREKSWDGKVSEDANIRRLPMRVAKQKQVYPTTSTKSTRSKKKA